MIFHKIQYFITSQLLSFLLVSFCLSRFLMAETEQEPQSLFLKGELSFIYLDMMPVPKWNLIPNPTEKPTLASINTLGLERALINIRFQADTNYSFHMQLRPDVNQHNAQDENTPYREFDGRLGEVYRAKPSVHLLDTYSINYAPSESYQVAFGVFSSLPLAPPVYAQIIPFGLAVELPQKFMALGLKSQLYHIDEQQSVITSGLGLDLIVLEGREDRGDTLNTSDTTHKGPQAQDPYRGAAFALYWPVLATHTLYIAAGQLSTKEDEGTFDEIFSAISWRYSNADLILPVGLGIDWSWSQERFKKFTVHRTSLTQSCFDIMAKINLGMKSAALMGVHNGTSAIPKEDDFSIKRPFSGVQVDIGLEHHFSDAVKLMAQASLERREESLEGGQKIGAIHIENKLERWVRRFAIGINYAMGREW